MLLKKQRERASQGESVFPSLFILRVHFAFLSLSLSVFGNKKGEGEEKGITESVFLSVCAKCERNTEPPLVKSEGVSLS